MATTIPSDSHVAGDTGHIADHNNIADVLTVIASGENGDRLASGESVFPRVATGATQTPTSGQMIFGCWTAMTTGTATTVTTVSGGTAAATLTYAAVGIYSVDSSGNLTKITDTGDLHTTLWASTYTGYTSTLSPSFSRVAGSRYAVAVLAVTSVGTIPAIYAAAPVYVFSSAAPILAGSSTATNLASLPASLSSASQSFYPNFMPAAIVAP
jgi:hypothetical protein